MTPRPYLTVCILVVFVSMTPDLYAQEAPEADEDAASEASSDAATPPEDQAIVGEEDLAEGDDAEDAEEDGDEEQTPGLDFELDYRIWGDAVTRPDFAPGDGERLALYQTLRLKIADQLTDDLAIAFDIDVLTGRIAGDPFSTVPAGVDTGTRPRGRFYDWPNNITDVRELYAEYMTPVGQLRAGLQSSDWGLGILANSGDYDNEQLFNQHYGGDRVFRAIFATAPLQATSDSEFAESFYVALGGDVVYRDENADFRQGDRAYQGVLAVLYDNEDEDTQAGTYVVYRNQRDRDEDFLRVFAFDLFGSSEWDFGEGDELTLGAAAEAALLLGRTNRALGVNTAEPLDVAALGAASELSARWNPADVSLHLLAGYASGDANSDDETLYRFRFDPNYKVGLVMFDHYLPQASLESYRRITDPANSQVPPKGAEQLISNGAVENAYYLNPQLRFGDPESDEDGLITGVGLLWAIAEQPVADPYSSFEQGGNPTGLLGADPASRQLGWEADASLLYRFSPVDDLTLEVKGEYGIFFPGAAFADASGKKDGPQSLARARLGVRW
ncbi:MAG: hypothetical protein ACQEVA_20320 [Myxococcota bacterium]